LHENAKAIVKAVSIPVTVKMRSGYEDTSLFKENLLAAQESGISFLTLHPRTKTDGYGPPANWDLIAEAKSLLKIPVVGNGDILNVADALRMLSHTKCDALMIGRGSVINPFIFHQIRCHFVGKTYSSTKENIPEEMPIKTRINKMKQLLSFVFKSDAELLSRRDAMLTTTYTDLNSFLEFAFGLLFKP
jgi:tRNA-dihydrouridine synthase C